MDVSGEMHHKFQRLTTNRKRLAAVRQHSDKMPQRANHALTISTVPCCHIAALRIIQMDVVHAAGTRPQCRLRRLVADAVGPIGDIRQRTGVLRRQQARHFSLGSRAQMTLRQRGDHPVPLRPPCTRHRHPHHAGQNHHDQTALQQHGDGFRELDGRW
jgi:hypothetical protein